MAVGEVDDEEEQVPLDSDRSGLDDEMGEQDEGESLILFLAPAAGILRVAPILPLVPEFSF